MTQTRQKNRFIMFIAISMLLLMQSVAAGHDQFHDHAADDCVVCKVVEVSGDKTTISISTLSVQPRLTGSVFEATPVLLAKHLWSNALSRAPPAS